MEDESAFERPIMILLAVTGEVYDVGRFDGIQNSFDLSGSSSSLVRRNQDARCCARCEMTSTSSLTQAREDQPSYLLTPTTDIRTCSPVPKSLDAPFRALINDSRV